MGSRHRYRQGNIFTGVCQSFRSQGGVSQHALGQIPPWADTPPTGQTSLPEMATAADGTHPTGMHSCLCVVLALNG